MFGMGDQPQHHDQNHLKKGPRMRWQHLTQRELNGNLSQMQCLNRENGKNNIVLFQKLVIMSDFLSYKKQQKQLELHWV